VRTDLIPWIEKRYRDPVVERVEVRREALTRDRKQQAIQPGVLVREAEARRSGYQQARRDGECVLEVLAVRFVRELALQAVEEVEVLARVHSEQQVDASLATCDFSDRVVCQKSAELKC
jgi:hypothetical protein